jgi:hypothetical protein
MKRLLPFVALALVGCGTAAVETDVQGTSADELKGGCKVVCPKCKPGQMCPMIACLLDCKTPQKDPAICGPTVCKVGDVCCNSSCGICTPPGGFCTMQVCAPVSVGGCTSDADCRLFDDYCTGCDCRALFTTEPDPVCAGPGVRCFAEPCAGKTTACDLASGTCVVK